MKVAIRADASRWIGSGHVMRCLTLADELRARGDEIYFICRDLPGNLASVVRDRGYAVALLSRPEPQDAADEASLPPVPQAQDAAETRAALKDVVGLLVVDHYALGLEAEALLRARCHTLMVIDDLADREHDCDVLLDQNLIADMQHRYDGLTPPSCIRLTGPKFALVRHEFGNMRPSSLERRKHAQLHCLLIFMGGGDPFDDTSKALEGALMAPRAFRRIDVVVGGGYAHKERLVAMCAAHPQAHLHVQTPHMAALMAQADLAITAGGSVSWEKCTLGVPSLVAVQAENQRPIADALSGAGAQVNLGLAPHLAPDTYAQAIARVSPEMLSQVSDSAAKICDGQGVRRVLASIPQL